MKFNSTGIDELYTVDINRLEDERGFFGRVFCSQEFDEMNLESSVCQANISYNKVAGTLRGMHYQKSPFQETKFIRCIRGSIYDVVIDLRKDSPTFGKYIAIELSEENKKQIFIPKGFAHGFIVLSKEAVLAYKVDN